MQDCVQMPKSKEKQAFNSTGKNNPHQYNTYGVDTGCTRRQYNGRQYNGHQHKNSMLSDNTYGADIRCTRMQHNGHQHNNSMLDPATNNYCILAYILNARLHKHTSTRSQQTQKK